MLGDTVFAISPARAADARHVGHLRLPDGGHGVCGGHPAVLGHHVRGLAPSISTLNVLPEQISQPQHGRGEEQEPSGEAIMETEPYIVNLDRIILAKFEEARETNNCGK